MYKSLTINNPIIIRYHLDFNRELVFKVFWYLVLISVISLLVFYIFQVNFLVKESYLISSYKERVKELAEANKNLETKTSNLNSFENLQALVQNLNYEKTGEVKYIKVLESTMAAK